jgi:hypothetical protein
MVSDDRRGRMVGGDDEILFIDAAGRTLERVNFERSWAIEPGVAMQLDPSQTSATGNDSATAWCRATSAFGGGYDLKALLPDQNGAFVLDNRVENSVGGQVFVNTPIDGVRVDWPDGFGLIRASNTTPVLVLRFEGHTPQALHRIEADMLALLRAVKPDATLGAAAH